jgi:predicted ABC-type transport system involved in lysophospholipase L1 biosynthesis ATPase subunit
LFGREVSHLSEDELAIYRRQTLGFIFQQFHLLPRLEALENVAMPLLYSGKTGLKSTPETLMADVNLSDRMHHRPSEMSGGQQQRVAIARSLVNAPRMLLADEPTGNLDTTSQHDILMLLREMHDSASSNCRMAMLSLTKARGSSWRSPIFLPRPPNLPSNKIQYGIFCSTWAKVTARCLRTSCAARCRCSAS